MSGRCLLVERLALLRRLLLLLLDLLHGAGLGALRLDGVNLLAQTDGFVMLVATFGADNVLPGAFILGVTGSAAGQTFALEVWSGLKCFLLMMCD